MEITREEMIRDRAHQLWEENGQVHGLHDEHWHQAEREIDTAKHDETSDSVSTESRSSAERGEAAASAKPVRIKNNG